MRKSLTIWVQVKEQREEGRRIDVNLNLMVKKKSQSAVHRFCLMVFHMSGKRILRFIRRRLTL